MDGDGRMMGGGNGGMLGVGVGGCWVGGVAESGARWELGGFITGRLQSSRLTSFFVSSLNAARRRRKLQYHSAEACIFTASPQPPIPAVLHN